MYEDVAIRATSLTHKIGNIDSFSPTVSSRISPCFGGRQKSYEIFVASSRHAPRAQLGPTTKHFPRTAGVAALLVPHLPPRQVHIRVAGAGLRRARKQLLRLWVCNHTVLGMHCILPETAHCSLLSAQAVAWRGLTGPVWSTTNACGPCSSYNIRSNSQYRIGSHPADITLQQAPRDSTCWRLLWRLSSSAQIALAAGASMYATDRSGVLVPHLREVAAAALQQRGGQPGALIIGVRRRGLCKQVRRYLRT